MLKTMLSPTMGPFKVGDKIMFRGNFIYLGVIQEMTPRWMTLTNAVWIPDTNRWNEFLASGIGDGMAECHPVDRPVLIWFPGYDMCHWDNPIPTKSQ